MQPVDKRHISRAVTCVVPELYGCCPQARGLPQAVHPEELAELLQRHPSPSGPHMDSVVQACLRPVHSAQVRCPQATCVAWVLSPTPTRSSSVHN